MKRISILGSTGSIGESTLQVARHLGDEQVSVVGLAAHSNIEKLERQAREFLPEIIAVYDADRALVLEKRLGREVLSGMEGVEAVASYSQVNFVISALAGTLGLIPTVAALKAGKDIGLANKESLVSGGAIVTELAREKNARIIPIDSEHSAIFQCLNGEDLRQIHRLILTSSGGPFRAASIDELSQITVDQALCHPNWKMGKKVTIDSSTLMNKGLEVIEAHWLFGIPLEKIEVIIHPQSIIHSMVEFTDRSIMAQMSVPTMLIPIQYALTYPKRMPGMIEPFDFSRHPNLQFFMPDRERFRCLELAYRAAREGGSLACYMNAANEKLVERFLEKRISWLDIGDKLERLMDAHSIHPVQSLDDVLAADAQAQQDALHA